nr:hypothetical protein [Tanacetum cinerariifolium]
MLDKWHRISKGTMHGRMNGLVVVPEIANQNGTGNIVAARAKGTGNGNQASLVRNVDSSTKFYMYPRFLKLMIRAQVGDLSSHSTKYSSPSLTQTVFANMRMVGKGFFRVDTPLFEGMIVAHHDDVVAYEGAANVAVDDVPAADEPAIPSPIPTTEPPPPS